MNEDSKVVVNVFESEYVASKCLESFLDENEVIDELDPVLGEEGDWELFSKPQLGVNPEITLLLRLCVTDDVLYFGESVNSLDSYDSRHDGRIYSAVSSLVVGVQERIKFYEQRYPGAVITPLFYTVEEEVRKQDGGAMKDALEHSIGEEVSIIRNSLSRQVEDELEPADDDEDLISISPQGRIGNVGAGENFEDDPLPEVVYRGLTSPEKQEFERLYVHTSNLTLNPS